MKKYIIPFFALALASTILFSCGADADGLEGGWTTKSAKLKTETFNEGIAKLVEAEYAKTNITFMADGSIELVRGSKVQKGVYSIGEGKVLTLKSAEGVAQKWSEECTIISQSGTGLTLVCKVDDKGTTATLEMEKK